MPLGSPGTGTKAPTPRLVTDGGQESAPGLPHVRGLGDAPDLDVYVDGERAEFWDGYGDATQVHYELENGDILKLTVNKSGLGQGDVFRDLDEDAVRIVEFEQVDDCDAFLAWESDEHRVELRKRLVADGGVEWAEFTAFQRDLIEAVYRLQDDEGVVGVDVGEELQRWYPDLAGSRLYANLSRLADRGVFETGSTNDQRERTYRVTEETAAMFASRAGERARTFQDDVEPDGGKRLVADGGTDWEDLSAFEQDCVLAVDDLDAPIAPVVAVRLRSEYDDLGISRVEETLSSLVEKGVLESEVPEFDSQIVADGGTTWYDLTGFQQTILRVLATEGPSYGLAIKRSLEARYNSEVNHGRLYPNLDDLSQQGLIEIGKRDKRTNDYALTPEAVAMLRRQKAAWSELEIDDEQTTVTDGGEETYSHVTVIRILRDDPVNETPEGALWFACGAYHDGDDYQVMTDVSTLHIPTETVAVILLPDALPSDEAMDTAREQAKDLIAYDPVADDEVGESA